MIVKEKVVMESDAFFDDRMTTCWLISFRQGFRARFQKFWHATKLPEYHEKVHFRVEFVCPSCLS